MLGAPGKWNANDKKIYDRKIGFDIFLPTIAPQCDVSAYTSLGHGTLEDCRFFNQRAT